ncbi:MAG: SGNH/GDSL hydrolase family protein [Alphaproteobacteria bacterium]|nr:SGNH/GDSL hydrolase family protein [Alphaproteobacteria bacterium]
MRERTRRRGLAAALIAAALAWGASAARAEPRCDAPASVTAIDAALDRAARKVKQNEPLTILAIGSSSTQGIGASAPEMNYPSRLEAELQARYPDHAIRVVNRGVGGEDAPEELARLAQSIAAEHPDLVIWQVGTNAVLRRDDLGADDQLIERGVALMRQDGIDVVLMDLQYAPGVLARPAYADMERLIAQTARRDHVGLFRRFDLMREWAGAHQFDAAPMIGADGLHMTDESYHCLALQLAQALARNLSPGALATKGNGTTAVARLGPSAAARR